MRWKKKGKRQTKEIFHSRTDQQRRPSHPLLPTRWNNTLREQTGEPLHQPRAHHCYHIWTEMGGTDGMEIPSLSSLLLLMQILFPPGPNHSYMFLFTFLHPKWDNPTCHLTQSFMHTGLFFYLAEKALAAGSWDEVFWCGWGEKCCVWVLYLWQHLILLTGKVQRSFWKSEIFFQVEAPRAAEQKAGVFWTRKGAG